MKLNWYNIRIVILLGVIAFFFGFAKNRNAQKVLNGVVISFDTDKNLFITETGILQELNLLNDSMAKVQLNHLKINKLEDQLRASEMLKSAQVYKTIDGVLGIELVQRKPILRFFDGGFQYLDDEGKIMPLSKNYSARVPIVSGVASAEIHKYYSLALQIHQDDFFRKNIVGFQVNNRGELRLELRDQDVIVNFGRLENINKKLANLKVFYSMAYKENLFENYSKIDLQYGSQVVCTKK